MSDNQIIRTKLRKLLPTLDLETATQRTIQEQLEDELGISLDAHKTLLKAEVDAFLLGQVPGDNEGEEEEAAEEPAAKKQKHAATPTGKEDVTDTTTQGPPGYIFSVPISSKRYAGVRKYNGRPMVDIREFYDKDGELAPGIKGLSHNPNQWEALTAGIQALNDALFNGDESFFLDLGGGNKRAGVSTFSGKMMVNLREYYEKDGKMLPGKKGISMPPDQWSKLCAAHEELTEKLRAAGGNPTSPPPAAATTTTHQAGPSAAGPSATLAAGAGSEEAVVSIVVAPMRRAEVVTFKGKLAVDVREFYERDGKLAHTKKGLQLPPEQFATLRDRAGEITAALEGQDSAFEILLTPKRKITISNFKGRYSVDIRESYEKDGKMLPGQKGLSLSSEQWTKLCDGLSTLDAALKGKSAA